MRGERSVEGLSKVVFRLTTAFDYCRQDTWQPRTYAVTIVHCSSSRAHHYIDYDSRNPDSNSDEEKNKQHKKTYVLM